MKPFRHNLGMCVVFLLSAFGVSAQDRIITGTVLDEHKNPLASISVSVKHSGSVAFTDSTGHFAFNARTGDVLVFSSPAYKKAEIRLDSRSTYAVALSDALADMGYLKQRMPDLTGSVATVDAAALMTLPVNNAFESLQGKAAGVDITSSQRPGTIGSIRVRGNRSLTASNSPLFVVNGVPLLSASGIETLNPRDIESITILKDASATAIYGGRGANGVVVVTTKSGKSGGLCLNYAGTVTSSSIVDNAPSMSAEDYITFRRWAAHNLRPDRFDHPDSPTEANDLIIFDSPLDGQLTRNNVLRGWESGVWDPSRVQDTDWTDFVTRTGIMTEHTLSGSGGSETMTAYGSIGYLSNNGTQKGQYYERYTTNLGVHLQPTPWLSLGGNLNASWSEQDYGFSSLGERGSSGPNDIYGAAKSIYNMAVPYDSAGNPVIQPGGESTIYTILNEWEKSTQLSETMRALANLSATVDAGGLWQPLEGLSYQFRFGPDFRYWREGVFIDGSSFHKIMADGSPGASYVRLNKRQDISWTRDHLIFYNKSVGDKHKFGVTLMQTDSRWAVESAGLTGTNISKDSLSWNFPDTMALSTGNVSISSGEDQQSLRGYMVRLNYGFSDKYLLTVSGRWDGASQFAADQKWGFFPAASVAWRIINEGFFSPANNKITDLKLRVGAGTVGNFPALSRATIQDILPIYYLPGNQTGYTSTDPFYNRGQLSINGPSVSWERNSQLNVGVDFGFFNNRIVGSLDGYLTHSDGQRLPAFLPSIPTMPGKTASHGVELMMTAIPVQRQNGFKWEIQANASWQNNQILTLAYGESDMVDNDWFIGQPIGVIYGFAHDGLWQDTPEDLAEMEKWNANGYDFEPGNVRPQDQDGDYRMTEDDRLVLGNTFPKWIVGATNTLRFKGVELSLFLYSRLGYSQNLGGQALTGTANQIEVDYWTPENPDAEFQKPILAQATGGSRDNFAGLLGIRKAGFVKIRYINLGYHFPPRLCSKIGMNTLRIYVQSLNPGSLYQAVDWYDFDVNRSFWNRSYVAGIEIGL